MSRSSDRARFYLEQCVQELRELLEKEVLTKHEVSVIAKKRSDFEHILAGHGSKAIHYIRYIAFEANLEQLKRKRLARHKVKSINSSGPRRLFLLFERATTNCPGDLQIWLQYLSFAKTQKAHKRVGKILTSALRLHPNQADLWKLATQYFTNAAGDITTARAYMQRGLRFCASERSLWLEYVKLEMSALSISSQNLNLTNAMLPTIILEATPRPPKPSQPVCFDMSETSAVSRATGPDSQYERIMALNSLASTPALTGDIPIAIFDAAMKQFDASPALAQEIFDIVSGFPHISSSMRILEHIVQFLYHADPASAAVCSFRAQLLGVQHTSPEFATMLKGAANFIQKSLQDERRVELRSHIAQALIPTLLSFYSRQGLHAGVQKVIISLLALFVAILKECGKADGVTDMLRNQRPEPELEEILRSVLS